jgi:hypothetical protein
MDDETHSSRSPHAPEDVCRVCGGDRRIANSFGLTTTCPSCHGTGRRLETSGFRDVTKTKPSHYRQSPGVGNKAEVAKAQWPTTLEGGRLATEVQASATCTGADKAKIIREIIDYETSHGQCTQTFLKKVRKQIRPRTT